jgi:hypothetical protein
MLIEHLLYPTYLLPSLCAAQLNCKFMLTYVCTTDPFVQLCAQRSFILEYKGNDVSMNERIVFRSYGYVLCGHIFQVKIQTSETMHQSSVKLDK